MSTEKKTVDRRTIAKGAAWTLPVIATAAAAPAASASTGQVDLAVSTACGLVVAGESLGSGFQICNVGTTTSAPTTYSYTRTFTMVGIPVASGSIGQGAADLLVNTYITTSAIVALGLLVRDNGVSLSGGAGTYASTKTSEIKGPFGGVIGYHETYTYTNTYTVSVSALAPGQCKSFGWLASLQLPTLAIPAIPGISSAVSITPTLTRDLTLVSLNDDPTDSSAVDPSTPGANSASLTKGLLGCSG